MPKITLAFYRQCRYFPTTEMSDETRICKTCGVEKPITSFYKQGGVNNPANRQWSCSKCYNKKAVERRNSTPEKAAEQSAKVRKWKRANAKALKIYNRNSRDARKRWAKKNKLNLEDSYVASRLGLRVSQVPPPLIQAMRHVLESNRFLWKLQQTTPTKNASETK